MSFGSRECSPKRKSERSRTHAVRSCPISTASPGVRNRRRNASKLVHLILRASLFSAGWTAGGHLQHWKSRLGGSGSLAGRGNTPCGSTRALLSEPTKIASLGATWVPSISRVFAFPHFVANFRRSCERSWVRGVGRPGRRRQLGRARVVRQSCQDRRRLYSWSPCLQFDIGPQVTADLWVRAMTRVAHALSVCSSSITDRCA